MRLQIFLVFLPVISCFLDQFQSVNQFRISSRQIGPIFNVIDGSQNFDLVPTHNLHVGSRVPKHFMDMPISFFESSTTTHNPRTPFRRRWFVFIPVEYQHMKSLLCFDGSNHGCNQIIVRLFSHQECIKMYSVKIARPSSMEQVKSIYSLIRNVFIGRNLDICLQDHTHLCIEQSNNRVFTHIDI